MNLAVLRRPLSELVHLVNSVPGLRWFALSPGPRPPLGASFVHSRLLVLGVAVGYQLDQVVVGVTHVQTRPVPLGA